MDHEESDMGAGPENNDQCNEETNNDNPQQGDLGPYIPESPLGRVEHKLDEVRNKTDGIPFTAAKIAHNNHFNYSEADIASPPTPTVLLCQRQQCFTANDDIASPSTPTLPTVNDDTASPQHGLLYDIVPSIHSRRVNK
ncbi:unnamed protein product [Heligmosomoides polygyrus]|uniref:Uncharacterized protein n=1 Tax=Heligmosomoides polygyrus TaxID=6339 RepID=A0A183F4R4_HELPZ|nr:unnamed protein product [Heligmosomoides polygyrus]